MKQSRTDRHRSAVCSVEEAAELASYIRIGSLRLELEELRSNVVGAQLVQQAISTSLIAGLSVWYRIIFMIIVYRVRVWLQAVHWLSIQDRTGTLNAFDMTLTLPGIAGIILSIGMAVDANVIILCTYP